MMYKLKAGINYHKFFRQIARCSHNVFFETPTGDRINLSSIFSRFVFITLAANRETLKSGTLEFAPEDLHFLREYVESSGEECQEEF